VHPCLLLDSILISKRLLAYSCIKSCVVIVEVCGHKFRALLDNGASHSYVSSRLLKLTRAHAVKSGLRRVATLLGVATTKLLEYELYVCGRSTGIWS